MIDVVVVDDQALVRAGLRVLIESAADVALVGEAANGAEAVRVVAAARPDVVLMDIRMPEVDGLEATRAILSAPGAGADRPVRVIILTTFELDEYVYDALRSGASGFLLKDAPPEQILEAIRTVATGNALLAPSVTRTVIAEFAGRLAPRPQASARLDGVTPREREVLVLVAEGCSNAEIAARLYLSAATVKTHVSRLLAKLGARDRSQLVVAAYESGIVEPG